MDKQKFEGVPEHFKGSKTDTGYFRAFKTTQDAAREYELAKKKLLNVSHWHTYAGKGTAEFQLTDQNGASVSRLAQEGDHFKIDVPGPGSTTGGGNDWVQIQTIIEHFADENDMEFTSIVVRPATNPNNQNADVAHFFKNDASSTFIVRREKNTLFAEVHGRNEKPNTEAESIVDKARNLVVAAGAALGFSEVQWKSLVKGILNNSDQV